MDKVKLEFKTPSNKTIEYKGTKFELNPFLSTASQIGLINSYLRDYFIKGEGIEGVTSGLVPLSETDYMTAEFKLMNYILQTNTNIESEDIDGNIYSDSELWDIIKVGIVNYKEFRQRLDYLIEEIKDQLVAKNSIGSVLSGLIEKAYDLLDKLGDISPEEIEKARTAGLELIKELKDSSLLESVPSSEKKS